MNSANKIEACKECGSTHIKILVRGAELDEFVARCPICQDLVGVRMIETSPLLEILRNWGTKQSRELREEMDRAGISHMGSTDALRDWLRKNKVAQEQEGGRVK